MKVTFILFLVFSIPISARNVSDLNCHAVNGLNFTLIGESSSENPVQVSLGLLKKDYHIGSVASFNGVTSIKMVDSKSLLTGRVVSYSINLKGEAEEYVPSQLSGVVSKSIENLLFPNPMTTTPISIKCELIYNP